MFSAYQLSASQAGKPVFQCLEFSLFTGEALIIKGPNGSGKSTLLRILAGLKKPDFGEIRWNGEAITKNCHKHANRVAWLGHSDALKPNLSLKENLSLISTIYSTHLMRALETMQLADLATLPVRMLSAGQKKRAALARILLKPAFLWLLDEPASSLDDTTMNILENICQQFRQNGGMIIASTHTPLPMTEAKQMQLIPISDVQSKN